MARTTKAQPEFKRPEHCLNCGESLVEQYCAKCGQNNRADRLRTRDIAGQLVQEVFDFEQPLLRTVAQLTYRPGQMCLEYIEGKRKRYSNPLRYCLVMLFLFVVTSLVCDVDPSRLFKVTVSSQSAEDAQQLKIYIRETQEFIMGTFNYVIMAAIPFLALLLKLLFLRSHRNYAEHLVFVMFIMSQRILFTTVSIPFGGLDDVMVKSIVEVCIAAYFIWAGLVFYDGGVVRRFFKLLVAAFGVQLLVAFFAIVVAVGFKIVPDIASGHFQEVTGRGADGDAAAETPPEFSSDDQPQPPEPP